MENIIEIEEEKEDNINDIEVEEYYVGTNLLNELPSKKELKKRKKQEEKEKLEEEKLKNDKLNNNYNNLSLLDTYSSIIIPSKILNYYNNLNINQKKLLKKFLLLIINKYNKKKLILLTKYFNKWYSFTPLVNKINEISLQLQERNYILEELNSSYLCDLFNLKFKLEEINNKLIIYCKEFHEKELKRDEIREKIKQISYININIKEDSNDKDDINYNYNNNRKKTKLELDFLNYLLNYQNDFQRAKEMKEILCDIHAIPSADIKKIVEKAKEIIVKFHQRQEYYQNFLLSIKQKKKFLISSPTLEEKVSNSPQFSVSSQFIENLIDSGLIDISSLLTSNSNSIDPQSLLQSHDSSSNSLVDLNKSPAPRLLHPWQQGSVYPGILKRRNNLLGGGISKQYTQGQSYLNPLGNLVSSHRLYVRYCPDCIGCLQIVREWNTRVEQALREEGKSKRERSKVIALHKVVIALANELEGAQEDLKSLEGLLKVLSETHKWTEGWNLWQKKQLGIEEKRQKEEKEIAMAKLSGKNIQNILNEREARKNDDDHLNPHKEFAKDYKEFLQKNTLTINGVIIPLSHLHEVDQAINQGELILKSEGLEDFDPDTYTYTPSPNPMKQEKVSFLGGLISPDYSTYASGVLPSTLSLVPTRVGTGASPALELAIRAAQQRDQLHNQIGMAQADAESSRYNAFLKRDEMKVFYEKKEARLIEKIDKLLEEKNGPEKSIRLGLASEVQQKAIDNSKLQSEISTLKSDLNSKEVTIRSLNGEISSLKNMNKKLEKEMKQKEKMFEQWKKEATESLKAKINELEILTIDIQNKEEECEELKEDLTERKNIIRKQDHEISTLNSKILSLEEEIRKLKLKPKKKIKFKHIAIMVLSLIRLKIGIQKKDWKRLGIMGLEHMLRLSNRELSEERKKYLKLLAENEALNRRVDNLLEDLRIRELKMKEIDEENQKKVANEINKLLAEIDELNSIINSLKNEIFSYKNEISKLKLQIEEIELINSSLKDKINELESLPPPPPTVTDEEFLTAKRRSIVYMSHQRNLLHEASFSIKNIRKQINLLNINRESIKSINNDIYTVMSDAELNSLSMTMRNIKAIGGTNSGTNSRNRSRTSSYDIGQYNLNDNLTEISSLFEDDGKEDDNVNKDRDLFRELFLKNSNKLLQWIKSNREFYYYYQKNSYGFFQFPTSKLTIGNTFSYGLSWIFKPIEDALNNFSNSKEKSEEEKLKDIDIETKIKYNLKNYFHETIKSSKLITKQVSQDITLVLELIFHLRKLIFSYKYCVKNLKQSLKYAISKSFKVRSSKASHAKKTMRELKNRMSHMLNNGDSPSYLSNIIHAIQTVQDTHGIGVSEDQSVNNGLKPLDADEIFNQVISRSTSISVPRTTSFSEYSVNSGNQLTLPQLEEKDENLNTGSVENLPIENENSANQSNNFSNYETTTKKVENFSNYGLNQLDTTNFYKGMESSINFDNYPKFDPKIPPPSSSFGKIGNLLRPSSKVENILDVNKNNDNNNNNYYNESSNNIETIPKNNLQIEMPDQIEESTTINYIQSSISPSQKINQININFSDFKGSNYTDTLNKIGKLYQDFDSDDEDQEFLYDLEMAKYEAQRLLERDLNMQEEVRIMTLRLRDQELLHKTEYEKVSLLLKQTINEKIQIETERAIAVHSNILLREIVQDDYKYHQNELESSLAHLKSKIENDKETIRSNELKIVELNDINYNNLNLINNLTNSNNDLSKKNKNYEEQIEILKNKLNSLYLDNKKLKDKLDISTKLLELETTYIKPESHINLTSILGGKDKVNVLLPPTNISNPFTSNNSTDISNILSYNINNNNTNSTSKDNNANMLKFVDKVISEIDSKKSYGNFNNYSNKIENTNDNKPIKKLEPSETSPNPSNVIKKTLNKENATNKEKETKDDIQENYEKYNYYTNLHSQLLNQNLTNSKHLNDFTKTLSDLGSKTLKKMKKKKEKKSEEISKFRKLKQIPSSDNSAQLHNLSDQDDNDTDELEEFEKDQLFIPTQKSHNINPNFTLEDKNSSINIKKSSSSQYIKPNLVIPPTSPNITKISQKYDARTDSNTAAYLQGQNFSYLRTERPQSAKVKGNYSNKYI